MVWSKNPSIFNRYLPKAVKPTQGSSPFGLQAFPQINNATSKGGMRGIEAVNNLQKIIIVDKLVVEAIKRNWF
jgi:hypothetical protein